MKIKPTYKELENQINRLRKELSDKNSKPELEVPDSIIQYSNKNRKLSYAIEQSANVVLITDISGNIEYTNPKFTTITGYSAEEVHGKNPSILKSGKHTEKFYSDLWKTISNGKIWKGEFCNRTKNGLVFWESTTIIPVKDNSGKIINYLAVKEDITVQKEADKILLLQNEEYLLLNKEYVKQNEELRKEKENTEISEEKYRLITESTIDIIFIVNKTGKVLFINNQVYKILGYKSEEVVGKLFSTFIPKKEIPAYFLKLKDVFFKKEIRNFITKIRHESGKLIDVEINGKLIKHNGKLVGQGTIRDITERKKTEIELKEERNRYATLYEEYKTQNEELVIAKIKAEESNRLKTESLNNMSHEIRTPLNGIMGFSQLLDNGELSETKQKYYINIIKNSGIQLLRIIDDILEISRLEAKQVDTIEEKVSLNDLLFETFTVFDLKAKENGTPLYLKRELSDEKSFILTDKGKLNTILNILLDNAIKFTNKGYIEFGYKILNDNLQIFVKDSGIGIKPENLKIIFERFSQEEKALSRKAGGLGLGLSIAKKNAELLGGNISLESQKRVGTSFFLNIPYNPCDTNIENVGTRQNEKKIPVLIVEDEEINFLYLEVLISKNKNNIKIIHAKNGEEAVEICKNQNIKLVLMDIKMPGMSGYEATERIKKTKPDLPVIAQTAYSTNEDKRKAKNAGCNDFISKPISKIVINKIIAKYLNTN